MPKVSEFVLLISKLLYILVDFAAQPADIIEETSSKEIPTLPNQEIDFDAIQKAMDEIDIDDDDNDEDTEEPEIQLSEDISKLLNGFRYHLESIDGGLKKEETAVHHHNVIKRIISVLGKVSELWNKERLNKWVSDLRREKRKAGTIKTYLGTIAFFLHYVRSERPKCLIIDYDQCLAQISFMVDVVKR